MSNFWRKKALFILALVTPVLFACLALAQTQTAQRGSVDWIFVLDTSASMHGAGGTKNIFDKVKSTIADFINSAREGDSIVLYTFDKDTALRGNVKVTSEQDKRDLIKVVEGLQSTGDRTYTGKAIHDALERAAELKSRPDAANRTVSIVLFTDGLEDVKGIDSPITIPSNISLIPKDQPYLFFVSLGEREHEKQLEDFVKNPAMGDRGAVIRDPGAESIAKVEEDIRKKIETPAPPKEANISIEPSSLDFGQVEPGEKTGRQTLTVRSDANLRASLALDGASNTGVSLVEPTAPFELKAGESTAVKVALTSDSQAADGARSLRLVLTPESASPNITTHPVDLSASLNIVHVPVWRKLLKYLLLLLILAALVIIAMSVIKGEPPWIWGPEIINLGRPPLEGEIEVIKPRPARVEDEFISLTQRKAKSLLLSSLVPNEATADADAELAPVKKNGKVEVQLRCTKGDVQVNKVKVASTSIYDGDIIELGEAKLRFNWVGHERPVENNEDVLT